MLLFADFVKSGTHQAEILLSSIGAAEALGRCAVGNVVKKALPRGADNCDDVRALLGCCLCLGDILIDIAGRDDDIVLRIGLVAEFIEIAAALCDVIADMLNSPVRNCHDILTDLFY